MNKIHLITGNDEYIKNEVLRKIKKNSNITNDVNSIVFMSPKFDELLEEITLPSFMMEEKLIIVYNSNYFSKSLNKTEEAKILEFFGMGNTNLLDIFEYLTLVFYEENEVIENDVYKLLVKSDIFQVNKHDKLTLENRAKLILDLAKKDNINLGYKEARYLCEIVEDDTNTAINEYNKIRFLSKNKENNPIGITDIEEVVIKSDDAIVYKIIDYIQVKNYKSAFNLIDNLAKENKEQMLLIYLYKYIRNSYISLLAKSENEDSKLIQILDLKPNQRFLVNKYIDFGKRIGINKCKYILNELTKLDMESKTSVVDVSYRLKIIIKLI